MKTQKLLLDGSYALTYLQGTIIDHIPNYYVFWKDLNGKYIGCNKAFALLAGQNSVKDLIGKSDYDFWSKLESDTYVADDQLVIRSKISKFNIEESQTAPWGEKLILSTSKFPLLNENEEVIGVLGIIRNITHDKFVEDNIYKLNLKLETESEAKAQLENSINRIMSSKHVKSFKSEESPFTAQMSYQEMSQQAERIWQTTKNLVNELERIIKK